MDVGIGLPSTVPGTTGREILDWARAADEAGFATLGTIDRVVYANYDSVPVLAAAAAVTERIRLTTAILIGPYRGNGALLAKQLASLDALSGGRLTVGIAVGGREDDFIATASPFAERGRRQDELLAELREVWAGHDRAGSGPIGPAPVQAGGPPLLIGGAGAAAVRRTVEVGAGWIMGGGGPDAFAEGAERVRAAWSKAGRAGAPRLAALGYYSLGPDADGVAHRYLSDYYSFLGEYAEAVAGSALTGADTVIEAVRGYDAAGCDELILFPCSSSVDQVSLLADLVLSGTAVH